MKNCRKRKIADVLISLVLCAVCVLALFFFIPYWTLVIIDKYTLMVVWIQALLLFGTFILGAGGFFTMAMIELFKKDEEDDEVMRLLYEKKELPPDTIVIGSPGSGKTKWLAKPIPSGTGKTKKLINPMIFEELTQQTMVDEACKKIAEELSKTIEREW